MKIEDLSLWEAFRGVAQHGNFSRASEHLRIPVPQVSKRVGKLEDQLGVRLFQRTTRVVSLTDEGRALLPKVRSILEDLAEAESFFENIDELQGTIKLTCVPFIAHRLLLPAIREFMMIHPDIHFELDLAEKFHNIIEAGFDMAIRIETPKDSDLVYRKLIPNDLIFCASPQYLKKNKTPLKKIEDLRHHDLLMLSIHRRCLFEKTKTRLGDFAKNKKITCEDGVFLTEMACQGEGILVRSIWDVQNYLHEGRLVQVLKKPRLETFGHVHAVVPSKRYLAPRVRVFLDFLLEKSQGWKKNH